MGCWSMVGATAGIAPVVKRSAAKALEPRPKIPAVEVARNLRRLIDTNANSHFLFGLDGCLFGQVSD